MAKETWKPGNMLYPVPAVMVSCQRPTEKPNIITVAWAGTVCTNPPMLSISVRPERYSHGIIAETGEFVVNLDEGSGLCHGLLWSKIRPWRWQVWCHASDTTEPSAGIGTGNCRKSGKHCLQGKPDITSWKPWYVSGRCSRCYRWWFLYEWKR